MTVELTPEEAAYLLRILKEHVAYYRLLVGNAKCSQKSHEQRKFVETLAAKLS